MEPEGKAPDTVSAINTATHSASACAINPLLVDSVI